MGHLRISISLLELKFCSGDSKSCRIQSLEMFCFEFMLIVSLNRPDRAREVLRKYYARIKVTRIECDAAYDLNYIGTRNIQTT